MLVTVARVLDQLVLCQLESLGLALPGLLQRPLRFVHGIGVLRRGASTDLGGLGGCGLFLLTL
jgi:hypothetical protein